MKSMPKTAAAEAAKDMQPLVLQNVRLKWVTTVILLQLEPALQQIVPKEQKGFWAGCSMIDHILETRMIWEHTSEGTFAAIDFSKAYDLVSHNFFIAAL